VYTNYHHNLCQRDGGPNDDGEMYHLTLVGQPLKPEEQRGEYLNTLKKLTTRPKYLGIGMVQADGGKEAYYVVVEWKEINEVRQRYKLPVLDLHVTLAFTGADVHGVSKGPETVFL